MTATEEAIAGDDSVPAEVALPALLARSLEERFSRYRRRLRQCRNRYTEKHVHDLRVAIRRLIAILGTVGAMVPEIPVRGIRRRLKKRFGRFGPLRDLHIQALAARRAAGERDAFAFFADHVDAMAARETRALKRRVSRWKEGRAGTLIRKLIRRLERHVDQRLLVETARRRLQEAFDRVKARAAEMDASRLESLHALRIAAKKYRYMAEILGPRLVSPAPSDLDALAGLQDELGAIQDREVLIRGVERLAPHEPAGSGSWNDVLAVLRDEQARAVLAAVMKRESLARYAPVWKTELRASQGEG